MKSFDPDRETAFDDDLSVVVKKLRATSEIINCIARDRVSPSSRETSETEAQSSSTGATRLRPAKDVRDWLNTDRVDTVGSIRRSPEEHPKPLQPKHLVNEIRCPLAES